MSKKENLRIKRFVKINWDRGYGDGLFEILAERGQGQGQEYHLRDSATKRTFWIYSAHTHRTFDSAKANIDAKKDRQAVAQLIGRK